MTDMNRLERRLPVLLDELAAPRTPDYLDDLHTQLAAATQRPAWSLPERWIPMADIASRPAIARHLPWRTIGAALIIVALLVAIAAVYVGSRQTKLPPPFGNARNGLVAYSSGGDIYNVDPRTGAATAIIIGPEVDGQPEYSPDGTKISFVRQRAAGGYDIVVAASDGSGARVVSADHPVTDDDFAQWSPDSAAILVGTANGSFLRLDATGTAAPVLVAQGIRFVAGEARPPDGRQILHDPDSTPEVDLWIMNGDGSGAKLLVPASALTGGQHDLSAVRWSPDGTMIAFNCGSPTRSDASHICVMNADGTGIRHLSDESDAWFETDFAWSPDSTRIAFGRWYTDPPPPGPRPSDRSGWRRSQAVPSKTPVLRRPPKGRSSIGRPTEPPFCHSQLSCSTRLREPRRFDRSGSTLRPGTPVKWNGKSAERPAGNASPTSPRAK